MPVNRWRTIIALAHVLLLCPLPNASDEGEAASEDTPEFKKHRETLLSDDAKEGWAPELRRYLKTMQQDVKKDTDIVKWWQVSSLCSEIFLFTNLNGTKDHAQVYPTLARIALDVLPSQASSVPCERLFSGTKQVTTDRRASLGPIVFEEVMITKSAWGPGLCDVVAWNAVQMEEVAHLDLDFEQMLVDDGDQDEWDKSMPGLDSDWFS